MSDKVQDLLFRAEFFIESHQKLRSAFLENMPISPTERSRYFTTPIGKLSLLNANLYVFEAVSCIASLLRDNQKDPTKNEISFSGMEERLPVEAREGFRSQLSAIFDHYEKLGLKRLRDKYVDHKDAAESGDPTIGFINLISEEVVNSTARVIAALKELYSQHFPDAIANNYFSDFYSSGISLHVQLLSEQA